MINSLLASHASFFKIIGMAIDKPTTFYHSVVRDVNLTALLGFYVQIIIAVMAFNAVVFTVSQTDHANGFQVFYFVIGVMNVFVGASVFSLTFWGALRIAREPATLSDVAKFVFVTFVAIGIIDLLGSTLGAYISYAASDGFAYLSDIDIPEPPLVAIIHVIDVYVLPAILVVAVMVLLYVSTGRSLRILSCFIAAWIVHTAVVTPMLSDLWMQVLLLNHGRSGT